MSGSLFKKEEIERGMPSGISIGAFKAVHSTSASDSTSSFEQSSDVTSATSWGKDRSCSTRTARESLGTLRNQSTPAMDLSLDTISESKGSSFSSDFQGLSNLPMSRICFEETFIPREGNVPALFDNAQSAKMRMKASQLFEERMTSAVKAQSRKENEIFSNLPFLDILINSICVIALFGGCYLLATTSFIPDSNMAGASEMATSL
jgi:hypothetical protein